MTYFPEVPDQEPDQGPGPGLWLTALAELPAPATTIDIHQAGRDGYRLRLRRRHTRMALSGTAAAGVLGIAAAVLPVTQPRGQVTPQPSSSTSAPTPGVRKPSTIPVHVPARFGWLPPQMTYIVEGPSGSSDYSAAAGTTAGFSELRIFLKVQNTAPPVPASKIPVTGIGTTAYWAGAPGQTAVPGRSDLVWRDAAGKWLTLSNTHLDPDTGSAAAALEHVARTVVVGDIPLPLPIHITSLPSSTSLGVDQAVLTHPAPGRSASTGLTVDLTTAGSGVRVFVQPAGTVQGPTELRTSPCKDSNGWNICVVIDAHGAAISSGQAVELLAHIEGLGTDPKTWSADLLVSSPDPL